MKYGELIRRQKANEKRSIMPKGFDISLADAISEFNLTEEQVKQLGDLTKKREIATAVCGYNQYYRRATLERLFPKQKKQLFPGARKDLMDARPSV